MSSWPPFSLRRLESQGAADHPGSALGRPTSPAGPLTPRPELCPYIYPPSWCVRAKPRSSSWWKVSEPFRGRGPTQSQAPPADYHRVTGATLQETSHLASSFSNVIPVTSSEGHMTLLDLSAPFLFRGRKRFYGWVSTPRGEKDSVTVCVRAGV